MRCSHCRQRFVYWVGCCLHITFRRRIPFSSREHKSSATVFFPCSRHPQASRFPRSTCNVRKVCLTMITMVSSALRKLRPCNSNSATSPTSLQRTPTGKKPRRYDSVYCNGFYRIHYDRLWPSSKQRDFHMDLYQFLSSTCHRSSCKYHPDLRFVSPENGRYRTASIRLGSRGDSYYEYLLLALCPVLHLAQFTNLSLTENSIFRL
jgi:hypothetical protein